MDIKEIALKVADSLRNKVDGISHMQSNQGLVRFAEALIESYKAELLKEVGEPVLYAEFAEDGEWLGDASEYADHLEEPHALFTSYQVAAAVLKAAKPLEEEIERLKGTKDVQLDIHSNNARTNQQRELDGPLEMGQLLADSKNEETGDPKAERTKSLAWMHTGDGHIADSSGKRIGIFSGDFKHRDRLICAVNSESDLLAQLAAAQEEIESTRTYFTTLLEEQRVLLAKAEQRVAEACALTYLEDYDLTDIAERVRAGEWRKFVKEM